jgi:hypothetical protein
MSELEQNTQGTSEETFESPVKKPYQKPEVRHERVFETMAMSCGKVQATQGSCRHNRKSS